MRTHQLLEEIARRMEGVEHDLGKVETAIIVREPATPLAAEAFEGLRKQVLASSRATTVHLAQLVEFDRSLRGGAQAADLQLLVDGWFRQAGIDVVFEPVTAELFDIHGEGEEIAVKTPAYVTDSGDGTRRILQAGVAVRTATPAARTDDDPAARGTSSADPSDPGEPN